MSRKIDIGKTLSDEDREYLVSRGRLDLLEQNRRMLEGPTAPEVQNDGNTGDVDPFKNDDGSDLTAGTHPGEKVATKIQAVETGGVEDLGDENKDPDGLAAPPTPRTGSQEVVTYEDNYDDEDVWSYRDLQAEAKERQEAGADIKASGSREEIIAALRADDAANPDEDEDEDEEDEDNDDEDENDDSGAGS